MRPVLRAVVYDATLRAAAEAVGWQLAWQQPANSSSGKAKALRLAEHVGFGLELVKPMLDDVTDAHDAERSAPFDRRNVAHPEHRGAPCSRVPHAVELAVFGFKMLGDALRDVLDLRLRGIVKRGTSPSTLALDSRRERAYTGADGTRIPFRRDAHRKQRGVRMETTPPGTPAAPERVC